MNEDKEEEEQALYKVRSEVYFGVFFCSNDLQSWQIVLILIRTIMIIAIKIIVIIIPIRTNEVLITLM